MNTPPAGDDTPAPPSPSDIEAKIEEMVGRQINGRLIKGGGLDKAIAAAIERALPALLEKLAPATRPDPDPEPTAPAKGTIKEVDAKLAAMQARLDASEKARADADARANGARLDHAAQAAFAKHLGADNPMNGPLYSHYRSRFALDDKGSPVVKFQREGFEESVLLDDGFKELLAGELKPYIAARTAGLPPAGVNGRGSPQRTSTNQQPPSRPWHHAAILDEVAKDRPELAQQMAAQGPIK